MGIVFTAGVATTLFISLLHYIIPALNQFSYTGGFSAKLFSSFVKAAIPEEIIKLVFFFITAWNLNWEDFSERFDAMLYMGMIGAGFGAYEDFSYIFKHTFEYLGTEGADMGSAFQYITWQRAFPGHILFNAISGYFLGRAKFAESRNIKWKLIAASLLVAIFAHGLFNLAASGGGTGWLIIYVLALGRIFFYLRTELLDSSPYRLIEQFYEGENLFRWEIMEKWNSKYPLRKYAELYNQKEEGTMGYFPLFISIAVLYPVAISGVYYFNLLISRLVNALT